MIRRCEGFTLFEVLVALGIIAVALGSVAIGMGRMIDDSNTLRERTFASWVAQNKITEMRLSGEIPEVSATSGEVDYANTTFAWRAVVSMSIVRTSPFLVTR